MSEADKDGDIGLENPDPEEDSDWSRGTTGQNVENVEAPPHQHSVNEQEGEDPEEDISCEGSTSGEANNEIDINDRETPLPQGELGEPQALLSTAEASVGNNGDEDEENAREKCVVGTSLVEGDSFEQDEQVAAPESENDAIQQACIESDQQLSQNLDAASMPGLSGDGASVALATSAETTTNAVSNERDGPQADDGVCSDVPNVFSGDVQVDGSNGVDAPEDDIRLEDQDESSVLWGGGESCVEGGGRPSVPEESHLIESQRVGHPSLDVERDSQIPECDRKEEGEAFAESTENNNILSSGVQRDQTVSNSSEHENIVSEEGENRNVRDEHSDIHSNHCKPGEVSSNSPSPSHSSIDQSSLNPVTSSESETSHGSGQEQASVNTLLPPCSTPPSHSNDVCEHSNVITSHEHSSPSHHPDTFHSSSSDAAPVNSAVTHLSISSPKADKKPSTPPDDAGSARRPAISTESSLDNHNPAATGDNEQHSVSKCSRNGSPSKQSFHANSPTSHRPDSVPVVQSEHKTAAASRFHQSKEDAVLESPDDFYQKQLALALSNDDDDDLDDIMSELDAELLSRSSPQRPRPGQKSHQSSPPRRHVLSRGQPTNDKTVGKAANGFVGDTEYKQLQDHNRQMLEQLKIRDSEIKKLYMERDTSRAELTKIRSECQETVVKASSSHSADDLYLPQIKAMEETIAQQQKEVQASKEKLISHDTAAKRAVTTLQNELKIRVDQVTKLYEDAVKEKDSMVVMFASSESRVMESKKAMEKAENRLKDSLKDKESLISSLKAAKIDKQKAVNGFEQKCSEVGDIRREMEKLKEALSSADYRIKWFQNKLKEELEAHKETKANLDKTTSKLKETKEETEIIRRECQAIVKTYQESEEIKSNSLDKELKIKESQLKLQMQEWSDNEEIHQKTKKELESLKVQHRDAVLQVNSLREQVQSLEVAVAEKDSTITQANELLNKQKTDITGINSKLKEKQNLDDDFNRAQEMIKSLDKDVSELKVSNRDLQKDMESCRERESKMLALQSELSRTNACLRSENTTLSNKATNQTAEVERLKMEIQELETTVKHLSDSVEEEKKNNSQAIVKLKASLEEKTKESDDFKQKWEDEIDSNKTLKRRHANNVKDLTRQLQQTKRRLELVEGSRKDSSGSMGSRTNSNGSLNSMADSNQSGGAGGAGGHHHQNPQAGAGSSSSGNSQEFPVITEQVEIDKQVLIERIVRLQKSHARKNEKLEFLGEHIQQLLEEIKKKTKIIQSYVMREESGTLSSEDMDANKDLVNEAYKSLLSRKGGIMASMYSQHQQDGNMTLELSLQINKKLQAVLEDTLLKNITLKENLDTLGQEISRLSQVNRKLQLHLQDLENPKKH